MAGFLPPPVLQALQPVATAVPLANTDVLKGPALVSALLESDPEVLITGWSTPRLPAHLPPRLRYVCHLTGSVRGVVSRQHLVAGLLVTNWGCSVARTVAESALMLALMALRRAGHWNTVLHRDGAWADFRSPTASLFERRVGFHGLGNVGRELARLIAPFGTGLAAYDPHVAPALFTASGVRRLETLEQLFAENDVVFGVAALVAETRGVITESLLRLLPEGGVFVNVSRGPIVDEAGLMRVAREGRLQVALDVFEEEPLPPDHPLRGLENVVLSPHLAGPTSDRRRDAGAFAVGNIMRYATNRPLEGQVSLEVYDRTT